MDTTATFPAIGWPVGLTRKLQKPLRSIMQAVVKTPRIEINIKGEIPDRLMSVLGGRVRRTDSTFGR